jgi:hypothetical protein
LATIGAAQSAFAPTMALARRNRSRAYNLRLQMREPTGGQPNV